MAVDVENLTAGTVVLDRYRVIRRLGAGGGGIVICAEDLNRKMPVAIKFLLPAIANRSDMAIRFVREVQAASQVGGEFVVQVIAWSRTPVPHIVMEYLEGEDLSRYRKNNPGMSVDEAVEYIVHAGAALSAAHRQGIVHRDIKPGNLFRTTRSDGSPLIKVLDFGISKFIGDNPTMQQLTKTAAVMGTPRYMSPEQMRCAKHVDHRTDIYSLGICLYELLAGTQPYVAESPYALAEKAISGPPDPLLRHRPDVPLSLARVLEKAYARDPEDRHADVVTFLRELAVFVCEATRIRINTILESVHNGRPLAFPQLQEERRIKDTEEATTAPENAGYKAPLPADEVTTARVRGVTEGEEGKVVGAPDGRGASPPLKRSVAATRRVTVPQTLVSAILLVLLTVWLLRRAPNETASGVAPPPSLLLSSPQPSVNIRTVGPLPPVSMAPLPSVNVAPSTEPTARPPRTAVSGTGVQPQAPKASKWCKDPRLDVYISCSQK